jgi:DNA-binding CsgD family transcriptional regulator
MSRDGPDDVPEDMPIPKVPIDVTTIAEVAEEYDIDAARLVETLEEVYRHVGERARDFTEESTSRFGEEAVLLEMEQEPYQHLYVVPDEWIEIGDELDLDESIRDAARAAHNRESERIAEEVDWYEPVSHLETNDVLLMPAPIIQDLTEGGLSHRQAFAQALRMRGDTHGEMSTKMSVTKGAVKSHCDRIDRKIERARRLLALVEVRDNSDACVGDVVDDPEALAEAIRYLTLVEEVGEDAFEEVPQWIPTARTTLEQSTNARPTEHSSTVQRTTINRTTTPDNDVHRRPRRSVPVDSGGSPTARLAGRRVGRLHLE